MQQVEQTPLLGLLLAVLARYDDLGPGGAGARSVGVARVGHGLLGLAVDLVAGDDPEGDELDGEGDGEDGEGGRGGGEAGEAEDEEHGGHGEGEVDLAVALVRHADVEEDVEEGEEDEDDEDQDCGGKEIAA